jgi:hypothetical protein
VGWEEVEGSLMKLGAIFEIMNKETKMEGRDEKKQNA